MIFTHSKLWIAAARDTTSIRKYQFIFCDSFVIYFCYYNNNNNKNNNNKNNNKSEVDDRNILFGFEDPPPKRFTFFTESASQKYKCSTAKRRNV